MDVFRLRDELIDDYDSYIKSFITINDERIREVVDKELEDGLLWPDPLVQINPNFEAGRSVEELADAGILHDACRQIFRRKSSETDFGKTFTLHKHQEDALLTAQKGENYILTTGTGSGKSLAYIIPIVNYCLCHPERKGIKAIIVYPMNPLANSQMNELDKFLKFGMGGKKLVRYARYTGQDDYISRERMREDPPDIILTNYVMLELMLTRQKNDRQLINAAKGLKFLVLDELHTYRGRQGADIGMLVRRTREILKASDMQCIGTSATMSSSGSLQEQKQEIARVATTIFGAPFQAQNIIGESLHRVTHSYDFTIPQNFTALKQAVQAQSKPENFEDLVKNPLASWIESTLGLSTDAQSGTLQRAPARALTGENGVAQDLAKLTGLPHAECLNAIRKTLLAGYSILNPLTDVPAFVFRLHQFISRGDAVYASIEPQDKRYITTFGQLYVPGSNQKKILLPMAFCRECGQPYFLVSLVKDKDGHEYFAPQGLDGAIEGFLYLNSQDVWPEGTDEIFERLPSEWLEEKNGSLRIKRDQKDRVPHSVRVSPSGQIGAADGIEMFYVPSPFRFCLHCGVTYANPRTNYPALATLSSGGRSTDTTLLSLSLLLHLKDDESLNPEARKLLSFIDNRQDASLQAGHFNDFIDTVRLRTAIYKAISDCPHGVGDDEIATKTYDALNMGIAEFTGLTDLKFQNKASAITAMKDVLDYRIYADLRRGWRLTSPNLEQCGLLCVKYNSLDEFAEDRETWQNCHEVLAKSSAEMRKTVIQTLLDYMRRELAIHVTCLTEDGQRSIIRRGNDVLIDPWRIDEDIKVLKKSVYFFPFSNTSGERLLGNKYLGASSSFGRYLRRKNVWGELLDKDETSNVIRELFEILWQNGFLNKTSDDEGAGYQLNPSNMRFYAADGTRHFQDPLRSPRASSIGSSTNAFFVNFYKTMQPHRLRQIRAHEHTAQVPTKTREEREQDFRSGKLPLLFCSPTMEVGVDISQLNAVNMRNVPPTPANYAQRSGRAGRSGQPALIFTYCTIGSPHDQYYFKRQQNMVSGQVAPPRLDLANEDLLRSHIQAVWLYCAELDLGSKMSEVIDITTEDKKELLLRKEIIDVLREPVFRNNTFTLCSQLLEPLHDELQRSGWWTENWLSTVCAQVERNFENACERWRFLYRSAIDQEAKQHDIEIDPSRTKEARTVAGRLRNEALRQLDVLRDPERDQADFNPYRYFASEGFLPGYSFPRLPVSAFVPGRKEYNDGSFLQRPRFLAISEFGPRSIIYHEGSRYMINKVNLPFLQAGEDDALGICKICPTCGYTHLINPDVPIDVCENCGAELTQKISNLFKMTSVSTRRRDHITSDEEERQRFSYEIITAYQWSKDQNGKAIVSTTELCFNGETIAKLTYGQNATIWRINKGWRNRENPGRLGFDLDMERGFWKDDRKDSDDSDNTDPYSNRIQRVVPYVEDSKNSLLFRPLEELNQEQIISFSAAFLKAVQAEYQLEDSELSAELLPAGKDTYQILFFESAEGGAGVLRRLVEENDAITKLARKALEICHFDPDTGEDQHRNPRAREDCEAACYDCLMSYYNQRDHKSLNRHIIRDLLLRYAQCGTLNSPVAESMQDHYDKLLEQCESSLERKWLQFILDGRFSLPDRGQKLLNEVMTRADFFYENEHTVIYVDGPHHDEAAQKEQDRALTESLEDSGYIVIRFHYAADWNQIIGRYPSVFGSAAHRQP